MGLKPDYLLTANSADITATIRDKFISLRWTDESGIASDILEIVLADDKPDAPIQVPPTGAELGLSLGYDGAFTRIGLFVCDEVELSGWPGEMTIRARAAPFEASKGGKTSLQSQKSRSWPAGTKLGDMVAKVAKEHGMESAVAASLKAIALPHLDQADESDLHFLVRVAGKYDAIVKPAGGKLVLAKRGEAKATGGADLPSVTLTPGDVSRFRMVESRRETAGQVVAYWHAVKAAKRHEISAGEGEPVTRLKTFFPTQEMALSAARAELARRRRQQTTLSLSLPGRTDLAAEGKLTIAGFRPGVDGDWIVTRVEHALDRSGYVCHVEAEAPNAAGTVKTADVSE